MNFKVQKMYCISHCIFSLPKSFSKCYHCLYFCILDFFLIKCTKSSVRRQLHTKTALFTLCPLFANVWKVQPRTSSMRTLKQSIKALGCQQRAKYCVFKRHCTEKMCERLPCLNKEGNKFLKQKVKRCTTDFISQVLFFLAS